MIKYDSTKKHNNTTFCRVILMIDHPKSGTS